MQKKGEFIFDIALGLSIIFWGIMGIRLLFSEGYNLVRLSVTVLNLFIGVLFLFRRPVTQNGSTMAVLKCIPSLILGGVLFKMAHPLGEWPFLIEGLFLTGIVIAIASFAYLGQNFSITPNLREVTTRGPYRIVRHPGYLGESMMVTACCLANLQIWTVPVLLLFFATLSIRIGEEEKLLSLDQTYRIYQAQIQWRLVPFVW